MCQLATNRFRFECCVDYNVYKCIPAGNRQGYVSQCETSLHIHFMFVVTYEHSQSRFEIRRRSVLQGFALQ